MFAEVVGCSPQEQVVLCNVLRFRWELKAKLLSIKLGYRCGEEKKKRESEARLSYRVLQAGKVGLVYKQG